MYVTIDRAEATERRQGKNLNVTPHGKVRLNVRNVCVRREMKTAPGLRAGMLHPSAKHWDTEGWGGAGSKRDSGQQGQTKTGPDLNPAMLRLVVAERRCTKVQSNFCCFFFFSLSG